MTVVEAFWAEHQVGGPYHTLKESQDALLARQEKFPELEDLMPTSQPGKTVLDYGCGPGHDTIQFLERGAKHVWFADISPQALKTTTERVSLHGLPDGTIATGFPVREGSPLLLPYFDHIHCAGVLHHASDPAAILREFRRVLNPGGEVRAMVYSGGRSPHTQSKVPVTLWWTVAEFTDLTMAAGFAAKYMGTYPCAAPWRPDAYADCYRLTHL